MNFELNFMPKGAILQ